MLRALNPANWRMPAWMNPRNWRMPAWMNPANWKIPTFMNPAKWPRPQWLTKIIEATMPAIRLGLGKLLIGLDAIFLVFDAWSNWTNKAQDNVDRIGKTVMSIVGAVGLVIGAIVNLPATLVATLGLAFGSALQWALKKVGLGFLVAEGELNADTHGKNVFEQAWTAGRLAKDWVSGDSKGSTGSIMFEGKKMTTAEVDAILKQRGVDDFIYDGKVRPINKKEEFYGAIKGGAINDSLAQMQAANQDAIVNAIKEAKSVEVPIGKRAPTVVNLYAGGKKFDSVVLDSFDSPEAMRRFGPGARKQR